MNMQELNELDFSNIGDWPAIVKAILIIIVCALVGVGWYYLDTEAQYVELERVERIEQDLRGEFEEKQQKAANLEAYRAQLNEMRESFGAMLRQLPNKTEVADLLVDVSQTGLAAGLEFELFQPQSEIPKDFYAELPIKLRVIGTYHEFGEFVSGLAALPRIVTVHDVSIAPRPNSPGELIMEATARTYRYLDEAGG
ncbi:type IV pilus inner membrane component PilO [Thiosocius teredinicola]|uniref:type 4a pilus biogenesis protein PilO n=1 Tax=Thiosocius teredinicola TaxID=1973002 RepID=UPI000990FB2E